MEIKRIEYEFTVCKLEFYRKFLHCWQKTKLVFLPYQPIIRIISLLKKKTLLKRWACFQMPATRLFN